MAYIKKNDFSILVDSNIDGYLDDCFECDDMIALVIQELNRKGYTTTFCCGGHPYVEHSEAVLFPDCTDPEHVIVGTEYIEKLEDGYTRVVYNYRSGSEIYIAFEDGKAPKEIPPFADMEDNRISVSFEYEGNDDYGFMNALLDYNHRLYLWAKELETVSML